MGMKSFGGVVGGLAVFLLMSGSTMAADLPISHVPDVVISPSSTAWADISLGGGLEQVTDSFSDNVNGSLLFGEARVGGLFGRGVTFQVDVHSSYDNYGDFNGGLDSGFTSGVAGHLGLQLGPHMIGLMASTGTSHDSDRWETMAGEGVYAVTDTVKLAAQAGWSRNTGGSGDAPYIHGVLQYALDPNWLVSANIGYVRPSSEDGHDDVVRYGAKLEMALNESLSASLEYQGLWRNEHENGGPANDVNIDNRIMAGLHFHIGGGGLAGVSPLHDFNYVSGVNNHFEY